MGDDILKTGSCSIILGRNYFNGYFNPECNKLMKITRLSKNHNDLKYLNIVRKIPNYYEYYSIPDQEVHQLFPNSKFYSVLKEILEEEEKKILNGLLTYSFIDNAGNTDLYDIINLMNCSRITIFSSELIIYKFGIHIMKGINYLHNKKLCHLDIKSENIMVNSASKTFKIIDFGFCSQEPFDDYVISPKGTPGYFPKYFENIDEPGLPAIKANDMEYISGTEIIPMAKNRKLVYKVDSFCMGRVLNLLLHTFMVNSPLECCIFSKNIYRKKLRQMIKGLTVPNVYKRSTISSILEKYQIL